MNVYLLLKYVHVLLAIVGVGFNASYGIWLGLARNDPARLRFALEGTRTLDRIANGAYGLLLVTGVTLAAIGGIPYERFWIAAGIALYLVAVLIGIVLFAPTARRQRDLLERVGPDDPAYRAAAARSTMLGVITVIDVLAIVFLMVTKPVL